MLKFICRLKEFRIDKLILKRIDKTERLTLCDFNTYCKATVSKTTWYWHNDIQINEQEKSIHLSNYLLIIDIRQICQNNSTGKGLFQQVHWSDYTSVFKKFSLTFILYKSSKSITDINKRTKTRYCHSLLQEIFPQFSSVQSLSRVRLFVIP